MYDDDDADDEKERKFKLLTDDYAPGTGIDTDPDFPTQNILEPHTPRSHMRAHMDSVLLLLCALGESCIRGEWHIRSALEGNTVLFVVA